MTLLRAPGFWGAPPGLRAHALAPLGALYGAVAERRLAREGPRAGLPSFVVGGLTLGGDGKTPLAQALTRLLGDLGERPAVLLRGHGGASRIAPLIVDPKRHDAREVGDEALLHAARALTIVGADRIAAARLAQAQGAGALVLDDGFHSRALEPDLALLAVDAEYGAGNGFCFPAGPLRAPLEAQVARADVVVVIGEAEDWTQALGAGRPLLRARLFPDAKMARRFKGEKVFAFAGLGRPEKFRRTLIELGADVAGFRAFPDHYRYPRHVLERLAREAGRIGARLVTTEKDAARIKKGFAVETLPVDLVFESEDEARAPVMKAVARAFLLEKRHGRK